jgi:hypothetical protein
LVDPYALGDPLLSKLSVRKPEHWRVGHYLRGIPQGYIRSLQDDDDELADPKLHHIYSVVRILTRDPIWSFSRFKEIAKMNLGLYDAEIRSVDATKLPSPPPNGSRFEYNRNHSVAGSGVGYNSELGGPESSY